MLKSQTGTLTWVIILVVCWSNNAHRLLAQTPKALVVVTDAADEDSVRRIGGKLVAVKILLINDSGPELNDYQVCNDRVRALRDFRLLLCREDTERFADRFWRQRLIVANPNGRIHCLSRSRLRPGIARQAERVKAIHEALSSKFPNHREQLNANLESELRRLYSLDAPPLQLVTLPN